ncbi:hypothetical protein [Croceicoccus sp. Ery5]|uniref:hypothetical protein n=1 Tax=Croceicoccus sp. Ery5 TaxID=1703340 RepID=UPI001E33BC78|nr:hypothetical protein [Croceicoccus sp. Ery5]
MSRWADYLAQLSSAEDVLAMLAGDADPADLADAERMLFMALASGWLTTFADRDNPDFVPAVGTHFNLVGTNPDFIYAAASIDGDGSYLITGERGESLFVQMDITAGGLGVMEAMGPSLGTVDFDHLAVDGEGRFSLMLSHERPAGWSGDWRHLDPSARSLSLRQASYDWGAEREARIAIERTDIVHSPRRWTEREIGERLTALCGYPKRIGTMSLGFIAAQKQKGLWNAFEHDDWAGRGGVEGQHYYQGLFRLERGSALLLETGLPETVRYWNVQLNDLCWKTIDWMNRQSSLNGGQASIDADGRFRAVIALDDPGIANWLDPGGHSAGSIMLRWSGASNGPEPSLTVIPLDELDARLPTETKRILPADREEALRARRRAVQMRRRW